MGRKSEKSATKLPESPKNEIESKSNNKISS